MIPSVNPLHHNSKIRCRTKHRGSTLESLESRRLMSAWTTVDPFHADGSNANSNNAMTTDAAGNVYAAGFYHVSATYHGIIREQLAGTTTWTTIEDLPGAEFKAITVDTAGNLYVAGVNGSSAVPNKWVVLERAAGATTFSVIDQLAITSSGCNELAVDSAGDVFAAGNESIIPKRNATPVNHMIVRERKVGQNAFTTVYDLANAGISGLTIINSGPNAGIYTIGTGTTPGAYWVVRKSSTGAPGTWTTIDQVSNAYGGNAIAADPSGNLYTAGEVQEGTSVDWVVKMSTNGGQSWTIIDDYQRTVNKYSVPHAIGFDLAGNAYVVGWAQDSASHSHAIIRSNAGGTWQTIDDFAPTIGGLGYYTFTTDIYGNLYTGGAMGLISGQGNAWIIRSLLAT